MEESQEESLASFMSISGADADTARQYLQVTEWRIEDAINLFMEGNVARNNASNISDITNNNENLRQNTSVYHDVSDTSSNAAIGTSFTSSNMDMYDSQLGSADSSFSSGMNNRRNHIEQDDVAKREYFEANGIRAPDKSTRQRLVGSTRTIPTHEFMGSSIPSITNTFSGHLEESSENVTENVRSGNLADLYRPPTSIIFRGSYNEARTSARIHEKWLLVNIQDEENFDSYLLNRDTWSDDLLQNIVASEFVFWQNNYTSDDGIKFCSLYELDKTKMPLIAVIDPNTAQMKCHWSGNLSPCQLAEKLSDFCDKNPPETTVSSMESRWTEKDKNELNGRADDDDLSAAIAASLEEHVENSNDNSEKIVSIPIIPDEPESGEDVTRIQIRTPNGPRLVRRFRKTDPVSLIFLFVKTQIPDANLKKFELRQALPPAAIKEDEEKTIQERNLENSALNLQWL